MEMICFELHDVPTLVPHPPCASPSEVGHSTQKYVTWEACVPCQSGRFKKGYGNQDSAMEETW